MTSPIQTVATKRLHEDFESIDPPNVRGFQELSWNRSAPDIGAELNRAVRGRRELMLFFDDGRRGRLMRALRCGFDEFPEFRILLKRLVFGNRKIRTIEKVFERVFIHDAIDQYAEFVTFEIDTVIAETKAMKSAASAMETAVFFQIVLYHFFRQAAEFAENVELEFLRHLGQFSRAGGIKNNLERTHGMTRELVARTGIAPVFQP